MKLPFANILQKKERPEYFLALLLRDDKVSAVILEEFLGKIKIIGRGEESFSTSIEEAAHTEFLHILDKTISKAEETLPSNVETRKTVFGVKESWVEEKKIKKDYLLKLKHVSEELGLTPIGFLVISEAIAHLLQDEEGAPLSAIICEVGEKKVTLSLFRAGRLIDSTTAQSKESVPKTVDTALRNFQTIDVLPSRIIVFNGHDEEKLAQTFIVHQWSRDLPFLHVPQISVLPVGFDARSIIFGAALQLGFEVLGLPHEKEEIKTFPGHGAKRDDTKKHLTDDELLAKEKQATEGKEDGKKPVGESKEKNIDEVPAENFGFVKDQDIEMLPESKRPHVASTLSVTEPEQSRDDKKEHYLDNIKEPRKNMYEEKVVAPTQDTYKAKTVSPFGKLTNVAVLSQSLSALAKIGSHLTAIAFYSLRQKLLLVPIVVILLLVGLYLLYISSLRATIILSITPKPVTEEADVTFTTGEENNDFSNNILVAKEVSAELGGSVSKNATGKKDIGDKAKGTVTLFNNSEAKKTLSQGTVITSKNNLKFVLDKDVTVASESGSIFTGTKPGTANAPVTADQIGNEYNLPSNTEFSVSNISSSTLAGKNESAFSGGSKKAITVVAKADLEKLRSELPKSLQEKAKNEFGKKVTNDEELFPFFTKSSVTKENFNKDLNDEAKTVTLKATVQFQGLSYKKNTLTDFAKSVLEEKYAKELNLSDDGVSVILKDAKLKDEKVTAVATIHAGLIPKINEDDLKQKVAGKSYSEAKEALAKVPQVTDVTIRLIPALPFLPTNLPKKSENITLTMQQEK